MNSKNATIDLPDKEFIYDHEMDKTYLTIYLIILAMFSVLLNGMSIYLTQRYDQLRIPHMYIRIAYATFDIIFVLSMVIHYVIVFQFPKVPLLVKCLTGDFCIALFFGTTQLTGFIALERYFYFCRPMVYNQYFTLRSIALVSSFIFLITQAYVFIIKFANIRKIQPIIGMCIITNPTHNMTNLLIFVVPAIIVTMFSVLKIIQLLRKNNVHPNNYANETYSEPQLRRRAAKKGLRKNKSEILKLLFL